VALQFSRQKEINAKISTPANTASPTPAVIFFDGIL